MNARTVSRGLPGPAVLLLAAVAVIGIAARRTEALSTAFTYQGQLQESGLPTNGTCDFQFSLFPDAVSAGSQVGATQPATATLTDGLFTVPLDFGGGAFGGADRYLQIQVRCPAGGGSYVTLSPRQKLTAAPYALYAPTAGNLSCSGCVTTGDLASGAVIGNIANGTIQKEQLAFTPVLSVGASAPLISSGGQNPSVSLSGVVAVANGGTGASTALTARNHLGAAASGANADITSLSGLTGNIDLPESTASAGNILKGGVPFIHSLGSANTFVGKNAGNLTTLTGAFNVAVGQGALFGNASGSDNTAMGSNALRSNTSGEFNVAVGVSALYSNTTGGSNTAVGSVALTHNQTYDVQNCTGAGTPNPCCTGVGVGSDCAGDNNTAVGSSALYTNTTGSDNIAVGFNALYSNTTGSQNSAGGDNALYSNTTGSQNSAVGYDALYSATSGNGNTGVGYGALGSNLTGSYNTAVGRSALINCTGAGNTAVGSTALATNTTGTDNTALGHNALEYVGTGSNNIAIGSGAGSNFISSDGDNIAIGNMGVKGESYTLRIGTPYHCVLQSPVPPHICLVWEGQQQAFIAGISGATSGSGVAVYVNASGQLGTTTSSLRFKTDIQDMGDASSGLMHLRPVRFRYKPEVDPSGLEQYGLVAEEVARAYPDLVTYDDEGRPQSVRYHFVNAMLLNEVQKQAGQLAAQKAQITQLAEQTRQVVEQARQIEALTARLTQLESALAAIHGPATASYKTGPGL